MARGAEKRIAAVNAGKLKTLAYGFLVSNTVFLLIHFAISRSVHWRTLSAYCLTECIAAVLALQLRSMAHSGADLGQEGLTAYMFDIIYITWFVHITTSLISRHFWWVYAAIPLYACYAVYKKILLPFVFGGKSPLSFQRNSGVPSAAPTPTPEPQTSKRQAKQQARSNRGGRMQRG
ncbi:hypothetical protein MVES1_002836 [Malassezia vespertilionis]|uniref:Uncharacterized protein n=1 Tax=Malassezia vespertilionis TaxID=2020962 RepID=A0A2N1JA03_9BASI|nr:uncharacterized protein MVES1_002836 [Malassezia vespertilionis]PKI83375.1 hypothetical protein MVES_002681 [Malassezia vespertilionis]WFD07470.1 hypothetical protein MVES1_002836 [Malassezia vespertilionis]